MSRLTRDGTDEPVSRGQILGHERGQGIFRFFCSADHVQDWQPYPVDPYSCYMCDHAIQARQRIALIIGMTPADIHAYMHLKVLVLLMLQVPREYPLLPRRRARFVCLTEAFIGRDKESHPARKTTTARSIRTRHLPISRNVLYPTLTSGTHASLLLIL